MTDTHVDLPTLQAIIDRSTFSERLQNILGDSSYTISMRRSVQTCVLLEADRCLKQQYKRLKPFQRKVALHDTASDIVDTLSFIPPHYRIEIMYRTAASKALLTPELSWRRMKLIDREIQKTIVPKVMQMSTTEKTHDEICNMYLQQEYEKVSGKKEPYQRNFEYSHDAHFTAYRMFYIGDKMNPNLPPAVDPNPHRVVPSVKPNKHYIDTENRKRQERAAAMVLQESRNGVSMTSVTGTDGSPSKKQKTSHILPTRQNAALSVVNQEAMERRALLQEIKDHLDILKELKGVIPEKDLVERKKALYAKLPKP